MVIRSTGGKIFNCESAVVLYWIYGQKKLLDVYMIIILITVKCILLWRKGFEIGRDLSKIRGQKVLLYISKIHSLHFE